MDRDLWRLDLSLGSTHVIIDSITSGAASRALVPLAHITHGIGVLITAPANGSCPPQEREGIGGAYTHKGLGLKDVLPPPQAVLYTLFLDFPVLLKSVLSS